MSSVLKLLFEEAEAFQAAGKLEESLVKWKEVRRVKDSPYAALRHVIVARELKRWSEAEEAAHAGIKMDPENREGKLAWLFTFLGEIFLDLNKADGGKDHLERARACFHKAVEIEERADFYFFLGATYMGSEDSAIAEQKPASSTRLEPSPQ